jgi:vacuolar-type H+-ATPase subunit C/Vma6
MIERQSPGCADAFSVAHAVSSRVCFPCILQSAATRKMVTEFQILRAHSVEPLSTFLDFITIEYMIDNVMLLLKGTLR